MALSPTRNVKTLNENATNDTRNLFVLMVREYDRCRETIAVYVIKNGLVDFRYHCDASTFSLSTKTKLGLRVFKDIILLWVSMILYLPNLGLMLSNQLNTHHREEGLTLYSEFSLEHPSCATHMII